MTVTPGPSLTSAADLPAPACDALIELVVRGMHRGEASAAQAQLVEFGLALVKGSLLIPTEAAKRLVGAALLIPAGTEPYAKVRALLEAFLPVNRELRDLCTRWQCRPDGTVNDHSDPMYDADVRDQLDDVHDAIVPIIDRLAAVLPRLGGYQARLADALDRLDEGDAAWLASPLLDSYHTVWMHLHQELLLSLDISRAEDAALEELLVSGSAG